MSSTDLATLSDLPILTEKQARFVRYYLTETHGNATRAAELAGYAGDYWTRAQVGKENLKKPTIRAWLNAYHKANLPDPDETLSLIADEARGYGDYLEFLPDGRPFVNVEKMKKDGKGHLVKGIKYTNRGQAIVELCDPSAARVTIAKYWKLLAGDDKQQAPATPETREQVEARLVELLAKAQALRIQREAQTITVDPATVQTVETEQDDNPFEDEA